MKERPILFSAPMVRAILEGRKTVTRRIVKPQPPTGCRYEINGAGTHALCLSGGDGAVMIFVPPTPRSVDHRLPCPYGGPGDRLWVRETFGKITGNGIRTVYRADGEDPPPRPWNLPRLEAMKWTPSIFMRRAESRITLDVTGVRVERLHAITSQGAIDEGIDMPRGDEAYGWDPTDAYRALWDKINGKRAAWASNPWVWVVDFAVVTGGS